MNGLKRWVLGMVAVALVGASSTANARLLDDGDAQAFAQKAAAEFSRDELLSRNVDQLFDVNRVPPAQRAALKRRFNERYTGELRRYALGLSGTFADSREAAWQSVIARERVIRFNAMSDVRGFASGRGYTYRVTEAEAARLRKSLLATYLQQESLLRERLDEMVTMQELDPRDIPAVRALAKRIVLARGRAAVASMKDASFFSASDANLFLEYQLEAAIDVIRIGRLGDPLFRESFLEEARTMVPAGVSGAGYNGGRREAGAPRTAAYDERRSDFAAGASR